MTVQNQLTMHARSIGRSMERLTLNSLFDVSGKILDL